MMRTFKLQVTLLASPFLDGAIRAIHLHPKVWRLRRRHPLEGRNTQEPAAEEDVNRIGPCDIPNCIVGVST